MPDPPTLPADARPARVGPRQVLLVVALTVLGAVLRIHDYQAAPGPAEDEYAHVWSGVTLIAEGRPTSWSWLKAYGDAPETTRDGRRWRLATPWLDHPPLTGLVYGGFAYAARQRKVFDTTLGVMRVPSLVLGIAAVPLFYFYALGAAGAGAAAWSTALFATLPGPVVASRLVVAENLILTLSLIALVLVGRGERSGRPGMALVPVALAPLAKVTGVFLALAVAFLLVAAGRRRLAIAALAAGAAGLLVYVAFGCYYDPGVFSAVVREQVGRGDASGLEVIERILWAPLPATAGMTHPILDGTLLFAWMAVLIGARDRLRIALPLTAYLLVLVATGGTSHWFYWYLIPFFPFLALGLGAWCERFTREPSVLGSGMLLLLLCTWYLRHLATLPGLASLQAAPVRAGLVAGSAAVLALHFRAERSGRGQDSVQVVSKALLLFAIAANVVFDWGYLHLR